MKQNLLAKFPALANLSLPTLEGKKKWLMLAGAAVLTTAAITGGMWAGQSHYVALFGSEQNLPVSQIVTVLDGEKLDYRIDPTSGHILVAESELSKARMILAGKGIQAISPSGYELMDKDEILGSSQFVQNVRYKRSLEGELAKSIMTLNPVASARVHLALNEESSFVISDEPQNSASVVLQLHYGMTLDDEQVNAIVHLVAGSIPGLKPGNVSVVDQQGDLLSENVVEDAQASATTRKRDRILHDIQDKTKASIANVLTSLVGKDNFRVSVMPELDLSKVEETQESLGNTPKVNTEQSSEETNTDQLALGIPGSLSNRPPIAPPANQTAQNQANNANKPQALSSHKENKRDYSYDRDVKHIVHPGYAVKQLKVAVVLNDSAQAVKAWKPEQVAMVTTMLNNAAGIDNTRGDTLSLSLLNFTPQDKPQLPEIAWWENPSIIDWSKLGGIGLLALLLLMFVLRPLTRQFTSERRKRLEHQLELEKQQLEMRELQDNLSLAGQNDNASEPKAAELSFPGDESLPTASSGLETKLEFLQKLAINDTDRVAEVIRQWITSNERVKGNE